MEQKKYGAPLNSLPYFDGSNYPHWKPWMKFILKCKVNRYGIQWNMDEDPR